MTRSGVRSSSAPPSDQSPKRTHDHRSGRILDGGKISAVRARQSRAHRCRTSERRVRYVIVYCCAQVLLARLHVSPCGEKVMPYSQSDVRAYLDSYGGLLGTRVEMVETDSQCFVRVIEDEEERTYSFEPGPFALVFAERQRVRLKLPAIAHPLTQPRNRGLGRINAKSGVSGPRALRPPGYSSSFPISGAR